MLQQALAAQLDYNSFLQTALSTTAQQLADSRSDASHLGQQLSTAQQDLAALKPASAANIAKLQHQLSIAQSSQQDTSARHGAAAAAACFVCGRLQAQAATLRSQLADALQQEHAAATASAASTALQQAQQRGLLQRPVQPSSSCTTAC